MKPPPTRPRWTTLAALIAAVLALHLLLLGQANPLAASPVPHWHSAEAPAERTAAPNSPPRAAPEATAAPALRATMHTVRWISPPAAPAATTHTAGHSTPPRQPQPAPPEAPQTANPQAREHRAARLPAPESTPIPALAAPTATEPETARAPSTPATEPNDRPAPETQGHEDTPASEAPTTVVALLTTPTPTPAPAETRTQVASPASPPTQAAAQRSTASTSALPPAQPPASVQLLYDVSGSAKGLNYRASSTLDWTQADGRYNARLEMRIALLGSRVQTSAGRVTANGLLPERFSDKSRSERAAHFDRTRQTIRFSNNQPDASLQDGAQDRLSLFMQLAGLLQAQASAYPVGQVISLQVAGTSDAEVWRFRVAEDDTLTLPVGTLRARHLVREPREPRDSLVELWFAPERGHLPVRIRITQENGDRVDQQLRQMLPAAQTP